MNLYCFPIYYICRYAKKCVRLAAPVFKLLMYDFGFIRELCGLVAKIKANTLYEIAMQMLNMFLLGVLTGTDGEQLLRNTQG